MGKDNKAQRTKNNARPSNSGRSAELLGNASTFVGFSTVKDGGFVPILPGFTAANIDEIDSSIDPNFQLLLKKMLKKDSTTKLKALQEFAELVQNSEVDAVKIVLPYWPRLYCLLAMDIDHRVREALHNTQRAIVVKAKRNIAPYLKQLCGPWFTSQYDTYPPAASAAALAFREAFPPAKTVEAIAFCQEEILGYVHEQLAEQNVHALAANKNVTPEELEARHQRILVSSLHGYALYLQKMPTAQIQVAHDANKRIVEAKKFWKLAKHSSPAVRNGWYTCVVALCQKSPDLLASQASVVVLAVLGNLDEADPGVLPTVWEAALHVITVVPDCWSYVSVDKLVLPKLWSLLRNAGHGNAAAILPSLLPFISKLPDAVTVDNKLAFYDKFFDNLRTGFGSKMSFQSQSECNAIAKCYVECVRYCLVKNQDDIDFCQHIITAQLLSAVKEVTTNLALNLLYDPLYTYASQLARHWDRTPASRPLLLHFWAGLTTLHVDLLTPAETEGMEPETLPAQWLLDRQVECCLTLRCPVEKKAVNQRVRFNVQDSEPLDDAPSPSSLPPPTASFAASLSRLATAVCLRHFLLTKRHRKAHFLRPLSRLVIAFQSPELFAALLGDDAKEPVDLYLETFCYWLHFQPMCCEAIVEVVFVLLKYLKEADKEVVLKDLAMFRTGQTVTLCLATALNHRSQDCVRRFLASEALTHEFGKLARALCSNRMVAGTKEVLHLYCTTKTEGGDFLMSPEAVADIVNVLSQRMRQPSALNLALALSEPLFASSLAEPAVALLLAMFTANVRCPDESVAEAVARGIAGFVGRGMGDKVMKAVAERVGEMLARSCSDSEMIDELTEPVWQALNAAAVTLSVASTLNGFLATLQPDHLKPWHYIFNALCESSYIQVNDPHFPSSADDCRGLFHKCLEEYVSMCALGAGLIVKLFGTVDPAQTVESVDVEAETVEAGIVDARNAEDEFRLLEGHMLQYVSGLALCQSLATRYASTAYYHEVTDVSAVLTKNVAGILKYLDSKSVARFMQTLTRNEHQFWRSAGETSLNVYGCLRDDVREASREMSTLLNGLLNGASVVEPRATEDVARTTLTDEDDRRSLLYDCDVSLEPRPLVEEVSHLAKRLARLLASNIVSRSDDIFVHLASWILSLKKSRHNLLARSTAAILPFSIPPVEKKQCVFSSVEMIDALRVDAIDGADSDEEDAETFDRPSLPFGHDRDTRGYAKFDLMRNHNVAVFAINVCKLMVALDGYLNCEKEATKEARGKAREEWKAVFEEEVAEVLVETFIMIAGVSQEDVISVLDVPVIEHLGRALQCVDLARYAKRDDLMAWAFDVLGSPVAPLQLIGYNVISALAAELVSADASTFAALDGVTPDLCFHLLLPAVVRAETAVGGALEGVRLGERCHAVAHGEVARDARAYLMLWTVWLEMCAAADAQLRCQYALVLREKGCIGRMLNNVFRLMPSEVLEVSESKGKSHRLAELFSTAPPLAHGSPATHRTVQHMACWVYWLSLCHLPAEVRTWWCGSDKACSALAERITTRFVSPTLCDLEMRQVHQRMMSAQNKYDNMTIKVHASVREISAVYTVDEARMELVLALPSNYPLGLVKIDTPRNAVGTNQHRTWLMQLTMFLTYQNGSLWNGLSLWKSNLDKRFEGIEECYICFSVLSGSNFQLPKVCCRTCKKKFHSACLYKWFSTSNKSTCPICRNQF